MTDWQGHALHEPLRHVAGDRRVMRSTWRGQPAVTRLLLVPVDLRQDAVLRSYVIDGRGSALRLPSAVMDTVEGYRVRARLGASVGLPAVLAVGVTDQAERAPFGQGYVFITTAWVEGTPLDAWWPGRSDTARWQLVAVLAGQLAALHERLVAYGDLKPSNVIVGSDGQPRLIDLDTLREVPAAHVPVVTTQATAGFAAPEQLREGHRETWLGSDVWSLGEVVKRLSGDVLTGSWAELVAACQREHPATRPTAVQIVVWLGGGALGGDEATQRVPEVESERTERVPEIEGPVAGGGVRTPVPGWGPEATVEPIAGASKLAAAGGSWVSPVAEADRTVRVEEPPDEPPVLRVQTAVSSVPRSSGRGAGIFTLATGAALVALLIVSVGGFFALRAWQEVQASCSALAGLRDDLREQKTRKEKNTPEVLKGILEAADTHLQVCAGDATGLGVQALGRVWATGWHYSKPKWNEATWAEVGSVVDAVSDSSAPEAQAAVMLRDAAGCRLLPNNAASERTERCARAHAEAARLLDVLGSDDRWQWLAVEVAWMDAMASLAEAQRLRSASAAAESEQRAAQGVPVCDRAVAWLGRAPVNGPEMLETCSYLAGHARDLGAYARYARAAIEARVGAGGKMDDKALGVLYSSPAPECASMKIEKGSRLATGSGLGTGGWSDWCRVASARAIGCGDRVRPPTRDVTCRCSTVFDGSVTVRPYDGVCPEDGPFRWGCEAVEIEAVQQAGVAWAALSTFAPSGVTCPL